MVGKVGVFRGMEEELTYELARLGLGLEGREAEVFLARVEGEYTVSTERAGGGLEGC